jgi:hypothetical protein
VKAVPFGWFGLQRFSSLGQSLPPAAALAQQIPGKEEAKRASEILKQFGEAEEIFHANNTTATRAAMAREFREERIFELQQKLSSQNPHLSWPQSWRRAFLISWRQRFSSP